MDGGATTCPGRPCLRAEPHHPDSLRADRREKGETSDGPKCGSHDPFLAPETIQAHSVRIFVLLFVAIVVGFHLTVGPDVVDLSGVWSLVVILAVLVLIVALFVVK
jgi:hypothetical protein